jgi:metallo-beta-lactamase class B
VKKHILLFIVLASAFISISALAAPPNEKTRAPFPAFRIVGNTYYVGSAELASYIISTHKGLILINTGFEENTPLIRKSIEGLGFKWTDIKILLISHAHSDHDGGAAQITKETGAKYEVMDADVDVVESGGKTDYHYYDQPAEYYPPIRVGRVLRDGDKVELGGTVLTAHLTPGHTKGCTTWTYDQTEDGRSLHVVIVGSPLGNRGMKIVNNPRYPQIAEDYERGFTVLRSLLVDVFLGAHGYYFNLPDKYKRFQAGVKNVWIDPNGYKTFVDNAQKQFEANWQKQKAEAVAGTQSQTPAENK